MLILIKFMEIFEKYFDELQEDLKYDQINILEKQLALPTLKHKWVARLIRLKIEKENLEKQKKQIKEGVFKKLESQGIPTGIPKAALNSKIDSSAEVKTIEEKIKEADLLIQYLDKVEKIFSSVTYDIGNATKLMVLETT
jgi:Recombination, repair and ssDNA binding protein UvsY